MRRRARPRARAFHHRRHPRQPDEGDRGRRRRRARHRARSRSRWGRDTTPPRAWSKCWTALPFSTVTSTSSACCNPKHYFNKVRPRYTQFLSNDHRRRDGDFHQPNSRRDDLERMESQAQAARARATACEEVLLEEVPRVRPQVMRAIRRWSLPPARSLGPRPSSMCCWGATRSFPRSLPT